MFILFSNNLKNWQEHEPKHVERDCKNLFVAVINSVEMVYD